MLLVNWKELKSLGKKTVNKTRGWLLFLPLVCSSFLARAEPENYTNPSSIVSIFLSLLLVIAIVFMLAFVMRRFNVTSSSSSHLKVITTMVAGTRERVMVIEVAGEQHLLGVTAHNINHLAKLDNPIDMPSSNSNDKFKDKLTMFMAGKLNPNLAQTDKDGSGSVSGNSKGAKS